MMNYILKTRIIFSLLFVQFLGLTNANATNNLALKLDVTDLAQGMLGDMQAAAKLPKQAHRFHCTVGFIEKINKEEVATLAASIQAKLQSKLTTPIEFDVKEVSRPFGSDIIGFIPTTESENKLIEFNKIVANIVQEVTNGRYTLNAFTSTNYRPHISLAKVAATSPDNALINFKESLDAKRKDPTRNGRFFLKLGTVSYTVMR